MTFLQDTEARQPDYWTLATVDDVDDFQVTFPLLYPKRTRSCSDKDGTSDYKDKQTGCDLDSPGSARSVAVRTTLDEAVRPEWQHIMLNQDDNSNCQQRDTKGPDQPEYVGSEGLKPIQERRRRMPDEQDNSSYAVQIKELELKICLLQGAFDEMSHLRYTAPEEALEQYKEVYAKRMLATDVEIKSLRSARQENEETIQGLRAVLIKVQASPFPASGSVADQGVQDPLVTDSICDRSSDMTSVVKARQIKTMYEDLTGLLFTDIAAVDEGRLYNCIQTGRNGTLHFKLFQTKGSDKLHYRPIIDDQRDASLFTYLPEYLTSDIEFSRDRASLFLWRLITHLQSNHTRTAKKRV